MKMRPIGPALHEPREKIQADERQQKKLQETIEEERAL
jgi:hypothetical protein